jgi:vacuolar-type H+-ATPase subunit H
LIAGDAAGWQDAGEERRGRIADAGAKHRKLAESYIAVINSLSDETLKSGNEGTDAGSKS